MPTSLTKKEMNAMNEILTPLYGAKAQISGGSKDENGYHLVIGDPVDIISSTQAKRMLELLKKKYNSNSNYYYKGTLIA